MKRLNRVEKMVELNRLNELYKLSVEENKGTDYRFAHGNLINFMVYQDMVQETLDMYQELLNWKTKYNAAISDEKNFLETTLL